MPTYNREDLLPYAIESVLDQSFQDFEFIIVNDGSKDDSERIINKYEDERIIYIRQKNRGEYPATNLGLRASSGKYITWIHSDDMLAHDSLSVRVEALNKSPNVDFVHGNIEKIDEKGKVIELLPALDVNGLAAFKEYYKSEKERAQKYLIHHTTIMFRSPFLEKVGYWDEKLPYAGDTDWLLRALKIGQIKKIDKVLYRYRSHQGTRRVTDRRKGVDTDEVVDYIMSRYVVPSDE